MLELKYRVEKISKIKRVEDELFLLIFSTRSLINFYYDITKIDSLIIRKLLYGIGIACTCLLCINMKAHLLYCSLVLDLMLQNFKGKKQNVILNHCYNV